MTQPNKNTQQHLDLGWIDQTELECIKEWKIDIANSILSSSREDLLNDIKDDTTE